MDDKILAAAQLWKDNVTEADLASELDELMADPDPEKLSDAFYRSLSFGTAGLRGTLGVGTTRAPRSPSRETRATRARTS